MMIRFVVLLTFATGCGAGVNDDAVIEAAPDAGASAEADAGASAEADAGQVGCEEGLIPDGAYCVGWRRVSPFQRCLQGSPGLVKTDLVLPWTGEALLAVTCPGEQAQVYLPEEDRWGRRSDVGTSSLRPPDLPPAPPGDILLAGALPDGTRVGIAGSLHAAGPFAVWIAERGANEWRRSIDVPWVNPFGAGAIRADALLFAGDESIVFVRRAQL